MVVIALGLIGYFGYAAAARFYRAGEAVTLTIDRARIDAEDFTSGWTEYFSMTVRDITEEDRARFRWGEGAQGVLVTKGSAGRPIASLDLVERVGDISVTNVAAFAQAMSELERTKPQRATFVVRRSFNGDYQHYYFAAKAVLEGGDIYHQHVNCYGYLPMFAISQAPLVFLGPQTDGGDVGGAVRGVLRAGGVDRDAGDSAAIGFCDQPDGDGAGDAALDDDHVRQDQERLSPRADGCADLSGVCAGAGVGGAISGAGGMVHGVHCELQVSVIGVFALLCGEAEVVGGVLECREFVLLATCGALIWGWKTNQQYLHDTLVRSFGCWGPSSN